MESASWQRLLYGSEITQNQAKMPLKSGFSDGLGGVEGIVGSIKTCAVEMRSSLRRNEVVITPQRHRHYAAETSSFCRGDIVIQPRRHRHSAAETLSFCPREYSLGVAW